MQALNAHQRGQMHSQRMAHREARCSVSPVQMCCKPSPSTSAQRHAPATAALQQPSCSTCHSTSARSRWRVCAQAAPSVPSFMSLPGTEGFIEVEKLKGIRILMEGDLPKTQYLVSWKDGQEDTWEEAGNLSEDLVREYEEAWWTAARKTDFDKLAEMLAGGKEVLSQAVDENRRSALHFVAALGKADCAKLLLEAGADPNLQDTQGYTPLHMAAGYMHTSTMTALLGAGANPQIKDNSGKDVVSLLEGIRTNLPLNMATIMQRLRLEEVANCLTDLLYEEAPVRSILEERQLQDGSREYLVAWGDGREDSWAHERDLSPSLLEDWRAGYEFSTAQAVLDMVQVGTERRFKVQWSDGYPVSWEPEEHVPPELITLFAQQNPDLFNARVAAASDAAVAEAAEAGQYRTQWTGVSKSGAGAGNGAAQPVAVPVTVSAHAHTNGSNGAAQSSSKEEALAAV